MVIDPDEITPIPYQQMHQIHIDEVFIINAIHALVEKRNLGIANTQSRIEVQLDKFYKHIFLHFANEERLMLETGYPAYLAHKSEHDLVFAEAKYRFREWKLTGNSTEMELFALEFMPAWIHNHIFSMDNPASAYIHQIKSGNVPDNHLNRFLRNLRKLFGSVFNARAYR